MFGTVRLPNWHPFIETLANIPVFPWRPNPMAPTLIPSELRNPLTLYLECQFHLGTAGWMRGGFGFPRPAAKGQPVGLRSLLQQPRL